MKAEGSYFSNFIMCAPARARARADFTFNAGNSLKILWTCHFWKTPQKNLNLQISIFSKIASFYPNLIIFFQWKLTIHTFQILSCAHARAHSRAPKPHFLKILRFWDFQWISSIQSKIGARACARRRAHDKIRKVWTFSFHWKKINKFGQKPKIFEKNENAHEIRKKTAVLCPGVKGGSNKLSICVIRQKYVERLLVSTRRCYREYYTHIYRGGLLLIHTEDNCTSVASIHRSTEIHTLITF